MVARLLPINDYCLREGMYLEKRSTNICISSIAVHKTWVYQVRPRKTLLKIFKVAVAMLIKSNLYSTFKLWYSKLNLKSCF